jgi:hypothetical protein
MRQDAASMCVNIGIYGQAGQNRFTFGYNWREANLIAAETSNYWLGIGYDIGVHPALRVVNSAGPLGTWIYDDTVQQKYIAYRVFGGKAHIYNDYIEDSTIHVDARGMSTINKGIVFLFGSHTGGNVGSDPIVSAGATAGQRTKFTYRKQAGIHFVANDNAHIRGFGFEFVGAMSKFYTADATSTVKIIGKQRNGGDTHLTNTTTGGTKALGVASNRLSLEDHDYATITSSTTIREIFSSTVAGDRHYLKVAAVSGAIFERQAPVASGTVTLSKGDATITWTNIVMADDGLAYDDADATDYANLNLSYIHINERQNYFLVRGQGVGQVFRLDNGFDGESGDYEVKVYKYRNNFRCEGGTSAGSATYPFGTLLRIDVTDNEPAVSASNTPAIDYVISPVFNPISKVYRVKFAGTITTTTLEFLSLFVDNSEIIKKINFVAGAGSGTLAIRINDIAVTTASALTLSTTIQSVVPTGGFTIPAGAKVDALITSPSGLSNVVVEIIT